MRGFRTSTSHASLLIGALFVLPLSLGCSSSSGDSGTGGNSSGGSSSGGFTSGGSSSGGSSSGGKASGGTSSGGTSSGGSSSGGTSSGGSSAGGTGGVAGATGTDPCEACIDQNCSAELSACDANAECTAMQDCYSKCADDTCYQNCYNAHPSAQALDDAITNCMSSKCTTQCQ